MRKYFLVGFLLLVLIFTGGCDVFNMAVQNAIEQTQSNMTSTKILTKNSSAILPSTTSTRKPTSTYYPTVTKAPERTEVRYTAASKMTGDFKGRSIEICGKVTYVGREYCPQCTYGYYDYLILDENFYIISYDWTFNSGWLGDYLLVKDIVETMGSKPIFVFGGKEGYDGSKCEIRPDGTLYCQDGDYFNFVNGCN